MYVLLVILKIGLFEIVLTLEQIDWLDASGGIQDEP